MKKSSKSVQRLLATVGEPVDDLKSNEVIGQLVKSRGNSLHEVVVPPSQWLRVVEHFDLEHSSGSTDEERMLLVLMPPKFRNTVFVKRGGLLLVSLHSNEEIGEDDKVKGDITNVVRNKRDWQKYPYWPKEFKEEDKPFDFGFEESEESEESEEEIVEQSDDVDRKEL